MQRLLTRPLLLSLISGVLLCISWPAIGGLSLLALFALVPMLYMEQRLFEQREQHHSKRIFFIAFLGFLLWNVGTTYFILYIREPGSSPMDEFFARLVGGGLTYVLNSCFMAIAFWLFHLTRRNVGNTAGYAGLVVYWMTFEYLHMHWSINWPWLNLGNAFAEHVSLIQWYEFTGAPGGTLWILVVNIAAFALLRKIQAGLRPGLIQAFPLLALITIPLVTSLVIYRNYEEQGEPIEMVCVQPNLDPYEEKFVGNPLSQLARMLELADSASTEATRFYVLPETALQEGGRIQGPSSNMVFSGMWEHAYDHTRSVGLIREFLQGRDAAMIAGVSDREYFTTQETPTARFVKEYGIYYDNYNSTLLITQDGVSEFYHKSKLVPGAESIPFISVLTFLDDFALQLGGTSGTLGIQEEREVFEFDGLGVAPTICYESVFAEFNAQFVQNGAQAITISTNDSWWQSSPGYKQLLAYARLRAIENRKGIARSANTGITCFINQRGDITSNLSWWTESALRGTVHFNDVQTYYSRHGDYLSRTAAFISVLLLLWTMVIPYKKRAGRGNS